MWAPAHRHKRTPHVPPWTLCMALCTVLSVSDHRSLLFIWAQGSIRSVEWVRDIGMLFTGSSDNTVIMWDIGKCKGEFFTLRGHKATIDGLAYSHQTKQVSGNWTGVRRWVCHCIHGRVNRESPWSGSGFSPCVGVPGALATAVFDLFIRLGIWEGGGSDVANPVHMVMPPLVTHCRRSAFAAYHRWIG